MGSSSVISDVINTINNYFTDYFTVILLIGTGIFFTLKTRFIQVRCLPQGFKNIFEGIKGINKKKQGVTPFAAFATAVGSQVGIGNIVGVSAALLIGGVGTVFWMWISAFFGMATVYTEAVAAQATRQKESDGYCGGPAYYIKAAVKGKTGKLLSFIFSFSAIFALGCSGSMIQSNAIASTINCNYNISKVLIGVLLSALCLIAFFGGVKRIAAISEKLVVIMAFVFLGVCAVLLCRNIASLPKAFVLILKSAFSTNAVCGFGVGESLKLMIGQGIKKGLFSNEAGLGTTPHIHAAAQSKTPHEQGIVAMMGVFVDSFVIMSMSALVMITELYDFSGSNGFSEAIDMNNMMIYAMTPSLGADLGSLFLTVSLFLFGYSSIISWNYFGRVNFELLFGKRSVWIYLLFTGMFIFAGCIFKSEFVWALADLLNNFMVIPNILALLILTKRTIDMSNCTKIV